MDSLVGITNENWRRILKQNPYGVNIKYWPKRVMINFKSKFISRVARLEEEEFSREIEQTEIQMPLIFILGHWRSGTTLLQNYLSLDPQFASPSLNDVLYPNNFLRMTRRGKDRIMTENQSRPMDDVQVRGDSPAEDEFALAVLSLKSQLFSWVFPGNREFYDRYLTFENVPLDEVEEWKRTFVFYLKKLTLKYQKPLMLKSPQHTARIRLLLELFPHARFIHIHREPYRVFTSTVKLYATAVSRSLMQKSMSRQQTKQYIIEKYSEMHRAYFDQVKLIPKENFIDIGFEQLEADPVKVIEHIYNSLDLNNLESLLPHLQHEAEKNKSYKKNKYSTLSEKDRTELRNVWKQSFEAWNY